MVIVTKNQYVLASKIHSVTLNEDHDWVDISIGRHTVNIKEYKYTISIWYTPDQQNPNPGRDDWKECSINLRGRVDAHTIYRDLVRQIREQMPDALFLDQALEQLLKQSDMSQIQLEEDQCKKEESKHYDKIASKIRRTRKAKRKRKKVLRRAKPSR